MDGSILSTVLPTHASEIGSVLDATSGVTARMAVTEEVLDEALQIRHAAYVAQGLIGRDEECNLLDAWDTAPSTKVIVVYKNGMPVATARVCLYAPETGIAGANAIPAMDVFHQEIVDLHKTLAYGGRPARSIEIARLARHPDLGSDSQPVFALYRMACYVALLVEADAVIAAVQRHHIPFYRRLGFQKLTESRPYSKLKVEGTLMACMRSEGGQLSDAIPILRLVSKSDTTYHDFLAGYRVPVFGTGRSRAEVSGLIGRLMEGAQTLPQSPKSSGQPARQTEELTAAA